MVCTISEPGKLNTKEEHGTIEETKRSILQMDCKATCIINAPSSDRTFISVSSDSFEAFDGLELGALHACYIAGIFKNS